MSRITEFEDRNLSGEKLGKKKVVHLNEQTFYEIEKAIFNAKNSMSPPEGITIKSPFSDVVYEITLAGKSNHQESLGYKIVGETRNESSG